MNESEAVSKGMGATQLTPHTPLYIQQCPDQLGFIISRHVTSVIVFFCTSYSLNILDPHTCDYHEYPFFNYDMLVGLDTKISNTDFRSFSKSIKVYIQCKLQHLFH